MVTNEQIRAIKAKGINISSRDAEMHDFRNTVKADKELRGLELISKQKEEFCIKNIQREQEHRRRLHNIRVEQGIFP
jgi:hypothetical protein